MVRVPITSGRLRGRHGFTSLGSLVIWHASGGPMADHGIEEDGSPTIVVDAYSRHPSRQPTAMLAFSLDDARTVYAALGIIIREAEESPPRTDGPLAEVWDQLTAGERELLRAARDWTRERAEAVARDPNINAATRALLCALFPGLPYYRQEELAASWESHRGGAGLGAPSTQVP